MFEAMAQGLVSPIVELLARWDSKTFWLYFACSALMAAYVISRRSPAPSIRGTLSFLFPRAIYAHPSAINDYKIWILNNLLNAAVLLPYAAMLTQATSLAVEHALGALVGQASLNWHAGWVSRVLFTAVELLVIDAGFFFAHYLQHRVPLLWQFHKTHHSAEVLMPITVFRMHPVDLMLHTSLVCVLAGGMIGIFSFLYAGPVTAFAVNGFNICLFAFYVAGIHLRHAHVWVMYPRWIAKHISSPALHLIHHSSDPKHADKNMAQIFNFWDRMFGTLYLPTEQERIRFGLWNDEHLQFRSLGALYGRPFVDALALLRPKRGPAVAARPEESVRRS